MKYAQGGTMFCGFFTKQERKNQFFWGRLKGGFFCAKLGKTVINNSQNKPT